MSRRARIFWFGGCGVMVVAGGLSAGLLAAGLGQILALVLIGLGLVGITSLVFFEVGLSEDRERAHERAAARRERDRAEAKRRLRPRLGRLRGRSRRLGR